MSGLSYHPGKVAQGQPCRGFESLSLRQIIHSLLDNSYQPSDKFPSRQSLR
jgi:hypothetical protein